MKTPSDDLFLLIKSLSTAEKIFFRKQSSIPIKGSTGFSYVKLFNAIDNQSTYDENSLKNKFKSEGFNQPFKKAKSYLANAILSCLTYYHSESLVNARLQNLILQTELLIEKGLPKMAKKLLSKAESLAIKNEKHEHLPQIMLMKATITINFGGDANNFDERDFKAEIDNLKLLKNKVDYRNLYFQMEGVSNVYDVDARERNLNKIVKSPLLLDKNGAVTFDSLSYYYVIHYAYYFSLGKWDDKIYWLQKEWIKYVESENEKIVSRANTYLQALANLFLILIKTNREKEVEQLFEKAFQFYVTLPARNKTARATTLFIGLLCNYMGALLEMSKPKEAINVWSKIRDDFSLATLRPNVALALYSNIYSGYFILKKYHETIKWLNNIMHIKIKDRIDIQARARIYILMCHYEIGNFDLLPGLSRATEKWFKKNNYLSAYEKIILDFFQKKLMKSIGKEKVNNAFIEMKREINNTITNPILADFIDWVNSKITQESIVKNGKG